MQRSSSWVGVLTGLLLLVPRGVEAEKVTHKVTYDTRALDSTLWYPDELQVIRGVLVFTGGQGDGVSNDTRAIVDNEFWQRFAASFGFAVLGNQFSGSYTNAAQGPGQALLDSLDALATTTGHPELAHAPLLVQGFSNGGYFSFTFTQFAAARVIAFCLNKSGFAEAPLDAAFLAVPGLLVWGSEEPASNTPTIIHSLVQRARPQHALWAELKEWGADHVDGTPERVSAPFFAEMIEARYPPATTPVEVDVPLIALAESSGWLADHADASLESQLPVIAAFADYPGDPQLASWLPSEGLANLWRGFVTKSPITLSSPAPGAQLDGNQPLQLTATGIGGDERATFLAGSLTLTQSIDAPAGEATATWNPEAGGVAGLVALAVNADGVPTRTSRPAHVVVYGKPARQPPLDAGVAAPDAAIMDAEIADAADADAPAEPVADGGKQVPTTHPDAAAPAADSGKPAHSDAGATMNGARVSGGCGCGVAGAGNHATSGLAACAVIGLLLVTRARRRVRH